MLWKFRSLGKPADTDPVLGDHLAFIRFFFSCYYPEQGSFSRSVDTDDPDLFSLVNATGNIVKNHLVSKNLVDMFYIKNVHVCFSIFFFRKFLQIKISALAFSLYNE